MAEAQELCEGVTIWIHRIEFEIDPPIHVFQVIILRNGDPEEGEDGFHTESFGSEECLRAFLRGLQAGSLMCQGELVQGNIHIPSETEAISLETWLVEVENEE